MKDYNHIKRITKELRLAGMTSYGLIKIESQHLPDIIHENEHIYGVVYGLYDKTIDSVMMVATDKRVLFMDCKPFYRNVDEITYEVVAGIDTSIVGPFAGVTLHTRVKNFKIRFVNIQCAIKFKKYIQEYIEKNGDKGNTQKLDKTILKKEEVPYQPYLIPTKKAPEKQESPCGFNTGVLSTVGKDGAYGAVVHYVTDKDDNFYVITKSETTKAKNILSNNNVALTIHQTNSLKYLQIQGEATIEQDKTVANMVFSVITSPKTYVEGTKMSPITKINKGSYLVLKIIPTKIQQIDYSNTSW